VAAAIKAHCLPGAGHFQKLWTDVLPAVRHGMRLTPSERIIKMNFTLTVHS